MNKKALIVGINYPGTSHELRGCVNDANLMNSVIREHYGFTDVRMLLDNDATTVNMIAELEWLVAGAQAGDILYFHYSGHGSQMRDQNGEEADGLDEIICPVDLNWKDKVIRDDDLKRIFETVPPGANLTVSLDCCNSGGGLDQDNQYQSLGPAERAFQTETAMPGRFLPPPPEVVALMEGQVDFKPRALSRNVDTSGMLLSGCQAHQTSADAYIGGQFIGAMTYFMAKTLKDTAYVGTYKAIIDSMNAQLAAYGYTQRPELNGPVSLFEKQFLESYFTPLGSGLEEPVVEVPVAPVLEPEKKDKTKIYIAIAVIAIIAIIAAVAA